MRDSVSWSGAMAVTSDTVADTSKKNKAPAKDGADQHEHDHAKGDDNGGVCGARQDAYAKKAAGQIAQPGHDAGTASQHLPTCSIETRETKLAAANLPLRDKSTDGRERKPDTTDAQNPYANLSPEGQALIKLAEKKIQQPGYPNAADEFKKFAKDVQTFEEQSKKNGLSAQEIKDTYQGVERLLNSVGPQGVGATNDGVRTERQRTRIAEQLINMAAHPEDRSQGTYQTCAFASVEGMLLTGPNANPSKVTKMVADVALTGQTNVNGVNVKLDRESLQSFGEMAENRAPGVDKSRLAENIFRLTAANVYYGIQRQAGDPEGQLKYVSRKEGNRLVYHPDGPGGLPNDKGLEEQYKKQDRDDSGPAGSTRAESMILNKITGQDYSKRIITNRNVDGSDPKWFTSVSSSEELAKHMKELQANGQYPVILEVSAQNKSFQNRNPFFSLDKGEYKQQAGKTLANLADDGHSLLVTDRYLLEQSGRLFPRTGKETEDFGGTIAYKIKNTWGADSNILVPEKALYTDTMPLPPEKLVADLKDWATIHQFEPGFSKSDKYIAGLSVAAIYTVLGVSELRPDADPAVIAQYHAAAHEVKRMWDALPEDVKKEQKASDERELRRHPEMKVLMDKWKELSEN